MFKFAYLAKRNPNLTADGFMARWRRHGALAMSNKLWADMLLYVQADPIRPTPIAGASGDFDAVCYAVAKDEKSLTLPPPEEMDSVRAILNDELETFSGSIIPVSLPLAEKVLKKGPAGGVTAFLFFKDRNAAQAAATAYAAAAQTSRVVMNEARTDIMTEGRTLPYKALVEVAAPQLEPLKAAIGDDAKAPWRSADLAVIAKEAVLWDIPSVRVA
jgi:hypothetical protein